MHNKDNRTGGRRFNSPVKQSSISAKKKVSVLLQVNRASVIVVCGFVDRIDVMSSRRDGSGRVTLETHGINNQLFEGV